MTEAVLSCPKCGDKMVRGYVLNSADDFTFLGEWIEGVPKAAGAFSFSIRGNGIEMPNASQRWAIGTFRCRTCGFLESYASMEFAVQ